jgi:hypothetical protein
MVSLVLVLGIRLPVDTVTARALVPLRGSVSRRPAADTTA